MSNKRLYARIRRAINTILPHSTPTTDFDDASSLALSTTSTLVDISTVPDSVLVKIFEFGSTTSLSSSASGLQFERVVAHVDSRWRRIAVAQPALWRQIDSYIPPESQLDVVVAYLERSTGNTLDLRLELSTETWRPLLSLIENHASRWRRMSLHATFPTASETIGHCFTHLSFPSLEHFSLVSFDEPDMDLELDRGDFRIQQRIFNGGAPLLSVLRLQNIGLCTVLPPLNNVTTLHLEEYRQAPLVQHRFHDLISALPSLTNLSIYGRFVESWSRAIHIPTLRSLRSSNNDRLSGLLHCISAPLLDSLVLKDVRSYEISKFLYSSRYILPLTYFGLLKSLSLIGPRLPLEDLAQLFEAFPSISRLELLNQYADDALGVLMNPNQPTPLLPLLRTVLIHHLRDPAAADNLISNLLAARPLDILWVHSTIDLDLEAKDHNARVKRWTRLDPWPASQDYYDHDDLFGRLSAPDIIKSPVHFELDDSDKCTETQTCRRWFRRIPKGSIP